jgi:hypothetical protein
MLTYGGIKGGSARTCSFKPLFGILNQPKYIPLSWCPMMMEFELVNNATDPIATHLMDQRCLHKHCRHINIMAD